ncbi:MAG: hypothetical protein A2Y50_05915 [Pseudomonadales bacterium RIFCSPLOWO2_12_59_9]|nr:MAG: hypothetical protein A2Y50_05915 [Pseudomonadales bacterium RIFCSPLOWO2_12_59_9]
MARRQCLAHGPGWPLRAWGGGKENLPDRQFGCGDAPQGPTEALFENLCEPYENLLASLNGAFMISSFKVFSPHWP